MKHTTNLLWLVLLIAGSASYGQSKIEFKAPKAYPEGLAYDPKADRFFVSSVTTGTIGAVDKAGEYTIFYRDESLKSSFGMKVDAGRNMLWVCIGDPTYSEYRDSTTYKKMARLIALDLSSGKKTKDIDLASLNKSRKHFPNDIALDSKGNIYITDSYSPVIYKVATDMKASVFVESELFSTVQVGLNGIVVHPSNFLIVAHNTRGALYRVDLNDPKKIAKIEVDQFFPGADGMILEGNTLYLVQGKGTNKVFSLTSKDGWKTATVTAMTKLTDRFQNPTTLAMRGDRLFVLNARLNELADSTMGFSEKFSIQEVELQKSSK